MRRALFAIFITLLFAQFSLGQSSFETITISLITGSPGDELYNTFGHSAIRINDPERGVDYVYNYGTFDFNAPNFYLNFTRGKLDYMLSVEPTENLRYGFQSENRSMVEQVLNLSEGQKRLLIGRLQENYKPENRYYKYDFFFDNCATRIRDIMTETFGGDFRYHHPEAWSESRLTFRNLIDLYLTDNHWSDFGIDIALGLPTDKVANPSEYMFLPDYLSEGFRYATIVRDGMEVPFTFEKKLILPREDVEPEVFAITPLRLMWGLFLVGLILSIYSSLKTVKIQTFDVLYFSIIGLVGWLVFLLWFFTDHIATKDNLNLLWAVPIYLPVFLFWNRLPDALKRWIIIICGGINVLILLSWKIFPQSYHISFIPLILIILMRLFFLYHKLKLNQK